ncbi:glycoside hydrolase family 1 protein [Treponema pedis]|uniref:glycoside hydrolase family 1 protein n=1 Tax=Treponema pedis TaxID=409322 RepID=UPI00197FEE65|nr:family 1 glycosylhydrolase [Treponema pedis]QSI05112.1 glycoside hydrolase family 1 protein [Treponema pedis]
MFSLKKDFLLGTATASAQIEGGRVNSNWNDFCDRKMTNDGSDVARANMHYEKVKEDIELLKNLKIEAYRMSVEWARIEPERGKFNAEVLSHYREELTLLKRAGIKPLLTLYHFSHPMWFENLGGFTKKENIDIFLKFVETCIKEFGDLCDDYITVNEPNVYAVHSYFLGIWPPEQKSFFKALKVMNVFIACHCKAYDLIHKIRKEKGLSSTRVSFAHHVQAFHPKNPASAFDRFSAKKLTHLFQDGIMKACFKGEFKFPFKNISKIEQKQYADFIAINYYSRQAVHGFGYKPFENTPKNDLGWDIYPEGLIECAKVCYDYLPLPIIVSENGTCDNNDRFRSLYIYNHLKAIAESDLPFTAYFHWCFIDNFEWKEGESARFGLIRCDYKTQERSIKKSGEFYRDMIEKKAVDSVMMEKYILNCKYDIR